MKSDGRLFALKEVNRDFVMKTGKMEAIMRERDVLEEMLDCPQIIDLECTFMDDDNFYFLMEYVENGTLEKLI